MKLGFGCMRLPVSFLKKENEHIKKAEAQRLLRTAYKNGVTYFDTAYNYHKGESQSFLGDFLSKYDRSTYRLANKLPIFKVTSTAQALEIFEEQRQKCRVDYFDNYLLHAISDSRWSETVKPLKLYEMLLDLKDKGLITRMGFSFHGTNACLREVLDYGTWDFVQIQLNYFDWDYQDAKTTYQILRERNIPIIVMEPVRGGSLHRLCPDALTLIQDSGYRGTPASLALRWVANLEGVETVLSGMSTLDQVNDNLATFSNLQPLTPAEEQLVAAVKEAYLKSNSIACTACDYCNICPQKVSISQIFSAYNHYTQSGDAQAFVGKYSELSKDCIKCNKCVSMCPQHIAIPTQLEKIAHFNSHL